MTIGRLAAIAFIFVCTAIAWAILGTSIVTRTGEFDGRLAGEVAQLWGGHHQQLPPRVTLFRPRLIEEEVAEKQGETTVKKKITRTVYDEIPLALDSTRLDVDLDLDQRRKGLFWYDTYAVRVEGTFTARNPDPESRLVEVHLAFPSPQAIYDGFAFEVNGAPTPALAGIENGMANRVTLPAHGPIKIRFAYRSRGLGEWVYAFAPTGVSQVRDFALRMHTDFAAIDYPGGTMSPTSANRAGEGWDLAWEFQSLVTGQRIGMDAPDRLNPGPIAARLTFFAPVCLLFFLTTLVVLDVLRQAREPGARGLHPMHYFFLSTAFFAFHLLLAYLVDHLDIHASFAIAAAVSVFLVVSYLRVVTGLRTALLEAGLAQVFFLVLFSYAFFFEGYTGLTITVGAVVTLFVLMQATARVDWARATGGVAPRPGIG